MRQIHQMLVEIQRGGSPKSHGVTLEDFAPPVAPPVHRPCQLGVPKRRARGIGPPARQGRPSKTSHDVTFLDDIGVSRMQSSRWQKVAGVPPKVIDEHATRCDLNDDELTTAGLLRYFTSVVADLPQQRSREKAAKTAPLRTGCGLLVASCAVTAGQSAYGRALGQYGRYSTTPPRPLR